MVDEQREAGREDGQITGNTTQGDEIPIRPVASTQRSTTPPVRASMTYPLELPPFIGLEHYPPGDIMMSWISALQTSIAAEEGQSQHVQNTWSGRSHLDRRCLGDLRPPGIATMEEREA